MTEVSSSGPDAAGAVPAVNVTALVGEALAKSSVLWIQVPEEGAWPVWFAAVDGRVLVVCGPGEQHLPWLPPEVRLILRSKDSGGRLVTVAGRNVVLLPGTAAWSAAAEALKAGRLNGVGDLLSRWAADCTIHEITPFGMAVEAPGSMPDDGGRQQVLPASATTARWRPWHVHGRPQRRRRTKRT